MVHFLGSISMISLGDRRLLTAVLAGAAAALFSACGGGDAPASNETAPASTRLQALAASADADSTVNLVADAPNTSEGAFLFQSEGASVADPVTPMYTQPAMPTSTGPVTLDGQGLHTRTATNCIPAIYNDFIDNGSWTVRRLMPRDCLVLNTNPPVFSWPQPINRDKAQPWTFTLRRLPANKVYTTRSLSSPRLALFSGLLAGDYAWQVSYVTTKGVVIESQPRRFTMPASAPLVLFPQGGTVASTAAAKPHPRALPTGSTFEALGLAARTGELAPNYIGLSAMAARALATALPASPDLGAVTADSPSIGTKLSDVALRQLCEQERVFIEALGLYGRFTGDVNYINAGIRRARNLSTWDVNGVTSEEGLDYANRAIYLGLAQAIDLYAGYIGKTDVALIVVPLKARIAQTMARFDGMDVSPYNSHVDTLAWSVTEALLYTVGTTGFGEASSWLTQTWNMLLTTANVWGADDGGFGNGVAYAWYRMNTIAETLAAIRVVAGVDLVTHPSIRGFGDYLMALTAPGAPHRNAFGDATEVTSLFATYATDTYRLFAALSADPGQDWYWRMDIARAVSHAYRSPWHMLLPGLDLPTATPEIPANDAWLFEDAGVAALHSSSADPYRSSVFFRASEFGSWNHSFADQNGFTFVSRGKDLLISAGYYPYFLSPHHAQVTRATRYKNALTFDGGIGQAESAAGLPTAPGAPLQSRDARGQLLNFADTGVWAVATGDASLAYRSYDTLTKTWRPLLSSALRTVAYNRAERVLVIYDYASSDTPRSWELNFHGVNNFIVNGPSAIIVNGGAAGCIDVYGAAGAFQASQGFAVAPENGAADQFHAVFSTTVASQQLATVTVVVEDCRSVPITVTTPAGLPATVRINQSAPLVLYQATATVP
jgi:hypothetical protein